MKKINNKGFTLLELLIAMSILTSVMFIGYNIFNKYSVLMNTQSNINKGQLNMNIVNDYLTKDLEQTTSIELKIDGEVVADTKVYAKQEYTDKALENAKEEIEDRLSKNNNFSYEYKLRLNDESKFSVYKVNIENKNKLMIYTLSLTDKNGVKVDFINNELVKEYEVPFYIIGENPYKVIMGYSDKKNNFKLHQFEVTSRIKQDLVAGNDSTGPSEGTGGGNGETGGDNGETGGDNGETGGDNGETGGDNGGTGGSNGETGGGNGETGGGNGETGGGNGGTGGGNGGVGDIVFDFRSEFNSNQININGIGKVKDSKGNYVEISNKSDFKGLNQLENFRIEIAFFYNQIQITGETESVQVTINQNQIGKDINNTRKLLLKVDESIEIKGVNQAKWQKLTEGENLLEFDSNRAVIYFDLSKSDFSTISFTLIEE